MEQSMLKSWEGRPIRKRESSKNEDTLYHMASTRTL